MTQVDRLKVLRGEQHTNNATFNNTPVTLLPMRPIDNADSFRPSGRVSLERNLGSLAGRSYPSVRGIQELKELTLNLEARGVNSNTGAAVAAGGWEDKVEAGWIFSSMFGADAPATTSTATTVAASGHTPASGIVTVTAGTNIVVGQVIAFATDAGLQAGRVANVATNVVTLDHPYNGTPTNGATVFRNAVWSVDDDLTHHVHGFFTAEGENWRQDFLGCVPKSFAISGQTGQVMKFSSVWQPTTIAPVVAEGNPAHAEPTSGNPIVVDAANVWVGGLALLAMDFTIAYDNGAQVRPADTKTNGALGGVCAVRGKKITIEMTCLLGEGTISGELQYNTGSPSLQDLFGNADAAGDISTTRKVSLQVGTEIGAGMYSYLPEADVKAELVSKDGLTAVKLTCVGTGALAGIFCLY